MDIIRPHLGAHTAHIDIGCGSGESLVVARENFSTALGFEINAPLVNFSRSVLKLDIEQVLFSADRLPRELAQQQKLFASLHILEHRPPPLDSLVEIRNACSPGDLTYLEVPLHTGDSFSRQGYEWGLWNQKHRMLFSLRVLSLLSEKTGFTVKTAGTRVFARASLCGSTRLRLLHQRALAFLKALVSKLATRTVADVMIADDGFVVLGA